MSILKDAALWMSVIGIGGIAGAIETRTSPMNAVVVLAAGCAAGAVLGLLDRVRYKKDKDIEHLIRPSTQTKKDSAPDGDQDALSTNKVKPYLYLS